MIRKALGALLLLLLVGAGVGAYLGVELLEAGQPRLDGFLTLPGLRDAVQVYRGPHGVPHLFAEDEGDLYRATGFVMAQDRLFQMDLTRRAAQGRLAEIFGAELVASDTRFRVLGLTAQADRLLAAASPVTREVLDAFSQGVNAYLAQADTLPPEFRLLGYEPEPWQPRDSVCLARLIGWGLGLRLDLEVLTLHLRARLGDTQAARLIPRDLPLGVPPLIPDPDPELVTPRPAYGFAPLPAELLDLVRTAPAPGTARPVDDGGSNSWVVAPGRSATGRPLLANDPHLSLTQPSFWYLIHQVVPGQLDVVGGAIPGTPTVLIGRNRDIAWGLTNVGADFQDLFLVRLDPPAAPTRYATPTGWAELERETVSLGVAGAATPQPLTVLRTAHGPLLPDALPPAVAAAGWGLALRWTGEEPTDELFALYLLNRARDFEGFRAALSNFGVPPQNVVYADAAGTVGFSTAGRIPQRRGFDGRGPVPADRAEYGWGEPIPYDLLPQGRAPEAGFLAIANQAPVGPGYPFEITTAPDPPYRAARIRQRLAGLDSATRRDLELVQLDAVAQPAAALLARVRDVFAESPPEGAHERDALSRLSRWPGNFDPRSGAALIFQTLVRQLATALWTDELGDLLPGYLAHAFLWPQVLQRELDDPDSPFLGGQAWPTLIRTAFATTVAELTARFGEDLDAWRWGEVHRFTRHHPLAAGGRVLEYIFARGPDAVPGAAWCPNATSAKLDPFGAVRSGPSLRTVADFAAGPVAFFTITGGQSGHPRSPHYDDFTALWLEGTLAELPLERDRIRVQTLHRLVLRPPPAATPPPAAEVDQ